MAQGRAWWLQIMKLLIAISPGPCAELLFLCSVCLNWLFLSHSEAIALDVPRLLLWAGSEGATRGAPCCARASPVLILLQEEKPSVGCSSPSAPQSIPRCWTGP